MGWLLIGWGVVGLRLTLSVTHNNRGGDDWSCAGPNVFCDGRVGLGCAGAWTCRWIESEARRQRCMGYDETDRARLVATCGHLCDRNSRITGCPAGHRGFAQAVGQVWSDDATLEDRTGYGFTPCWRDEG
jgi:hypothetical protein